jgi:alpha 1,2-mannosyltransferase
MCRYESGFFFRHELLLDYEFYWRVEPSIDLFCDIDYDVFRYMADNDKKYGFVLSLYEYVETIPTLWDSVKAYMKEHPEHIHPDNAMGFLSDDGGKTYKAYMDFFEKLDRDGGFFYERWGDAPVHSIAASLLLDKKQIHFFEDIAYDSQTRIRWYPDC